MATSICDCIQNSECWNQWFWLHPPHGCCGCCEGASDCGTCDYRWTVYDGKPDEWVQMNSNCNDDIRVPWAGGWYICYCISPSIDGTVNGEIATTNCELTYIQSLYVKGKNLIGINLDVLKQIRKGVYKPQGCNCGGTMRKQAVKNVVRNELISANVVRKELLGKKKKIF